VKVDNIERMKTAGNYVNLESGGRIYPLSSTLENLSKRLAEKGFCRTHHPYPVNFSANGRISYQPSGDGEIRLNNGNVVVLSRTYKNEFKQRL
jgi:DNA-binding LytR/AlgR family response regulator